jgi:hypothetical protein
MCEYNKNMIDIFADDSDEEEYVNEPCENLTCSVCNLKSCYHQQYVCSSCTKTVCGGCMDDCGSIPICSVCVVTNDKPVEGSYIKTLARILTDTIKV